MPVEPKATQPSSESARERSRLRGRKPAAASARPPSPTRTIQVGNFHVQLAEGLLKLLQKQAAARGVVIDVGEFPTPDASAVQDADPARPTRIMAHAIARIADRIPLSRKINRHLEGTENRAGLGSDILALMVELLKRNPQTVQDQVSHFGEELARARSEKNAQNNGAPFAPTTEGVSE